MKTFRQIFFLCLLWMIGIGVHAEEIPNNEIWYTSKNEQIVKPYETDRFGARIVSNTYSNGKGVIKFDNSVTSIGRFAFEGCTGLASINIPNSVTSIGQAAFLDCTGLTSINIPNSVTSIGGDAFYGCSSITSIKWDSDLDPGGVISDCKDKLKEIFFGKNTTRIRYWGRLDFSGITSITVDNSNPEYDSRDYCNAIITRYNELILGCKNTVIPNSVTSIGDYAFYNCTGLTSINIPKSVRSIGKCAFYGCTGLTSINIPHSVTSIGQAAFSGCTGLTSINIPNSVRSIERSAFSGCTGLTSVTIPNSVTSIGQSAFNGCTGLTSIDIPNSVTSIGQAAFYGCTGLTSIDIPNSVTSIGDYAFYNCSGLTSIDIPNSVTSIGSDAFSGCTGLTSIDIPNSVTSIGDYAFYNCSGLTSINIPNSVTSIGQAAFYGCTGLTSIDIPNSVTSIGSDAFDGCFKLYNVIWESNASFYNESGRWINISIDYCKNLIISDNVEHIGRFCNSKYLQMISIPKSVKSIDSGAFGSCTNISEVYCYSSEPPATNSTKNYLVFDATTYLSGTLYVPLGSKDKYMNAPNWEQFSNIVEFDSEATGLNQIQSKIGKVTTHIHTLDGRQINSITKSGFYIINGTKKYVNIR